MQRLVVTVALSSFPLVVSSGLLAEVRGETCESQSLFIENGGVARGKSGQGLTNTAPVLLQVQVKHAMAKSDPWRAVPASWDERSHEGDALLELTGSSRGPRFRRRRRCEDDLGFRDPVYEARCIEWVGYTCTLPRHEATDLLREACPLSCGVCDATSPVHADVPPPGAGFTTTTTTTTTPSLPLCDELLTSNDRPRRWSFACRLWKGHDCRGYHFSPRLLAACPEECGLCRST